MGVAGFIALCGGVIAIVQYLERREERSHRRISSDLEMSRLPAEVELNVLDQLVVEGDREVPP